MGVLLLYVKYVTYYVGIVLLYIVAFTLYHLFSSLKQLRHGG
jgi:hypothetical protein